LVAVTPTEPPRLLHAPGIVEVRRPETGERLWGDYASLGWYDVNGTTYLLGLAYPDGYAVARWTQAWTGQDLEPQLPGTELGSPLIDNLGEHHEFATAAARYLVGPRATRRGRGQPAADRARPAGPADTARLRRRSAGASAGCSELGTGGRSAGPDRRATGGQRVVTGHLRRQRHGEGRALTKSIYVEQYEARRGFASRWS
jgi:hypothetical protein